MHLEIPGCQDSRSKIAGNLLIDGILLQKTIGWRESELAAWIATKLVNVVLPGRHGMVLGADGMFRLKPGQICIPDAAFISRKRYANRTSQSDAFWDLGCDLAVEVISPSNTHREMERKLADYFGAGVRLVWLVYPKSREVAVYTTPQHSVLLRGDELLEGGDVLPGFAPSAKSSASWIRRKNNDRTAKSPHLSILCSACVFAPLARIVALARSLQL